MLCILLARLPALGIAFIRVISSLLTPRSLASSSDTGCILRAFDDVPPTPTPPLPTLPPPEVPLLTPLETLDTPAFPLDGSLEWRYW